MTEFNTARLQPGTGRKLRRGLAASALLVAATGSSIVAGGATAHAGPTNPDTSIYWVNAANPSIARANLDGTGANQSFIPDTALPDFPEFVAADSNSLYWTNASGGTIGRSKLDGTDPDNSFLSISPTANPQGIAVDGNFIYWLDRATGTIGRANLDGSGTVDDTFITGLSGGLGITVDGNYVYWADNNGIGRAPLSGGPGTENFIPLSGSITGVAVDSTYIYWTDASTPGDIGRANLDGSGIPDDDFITGVGAVNDLAVDASGIYWTEAATFAIGEANLDGTGANDSYITGGEQPDGIALGPSANAPTVTGVSPSSGPAGTTVTVSGTYLTGATSVQFGTTTVTTGIVPAPDGDSLTVPAPAGAGTVDVTVTTGDGTSATSPADQYTYFAVPDAPTGLTADPGVGEVELNWSAPTNDGGTAITKYEVFRGTTAGGESVTPLATVTSTTSYTDLAAAPGTEYFYVVEAFNSVGHSTPSNEASATVSFAPSAPLGLTATAGPNEIVLNWSAPASDGGSPIEEYGVFRGTTPGGEAETLVAGVPAPGTSYTDHSVVPGTTYYYAILALSNGGGSVPSNEASAIIPVAPSAPTALSATPAPGGVALTWTAPANDGGSDVTGYRVFRGTTEGGEAVTPLITVTSGTSFTDTSAVPGVTYFYTVEAVNSVGASVPSNESAATAAVVTAPSAPTALTATAGANDIALSWSAPAADGGAAVQSYQVFRSTAGSPPSAMPLATVTSGTTYIDSSVTPGVPYTYTVEAVNSVGSSAPSSGATATVATTHSTGGLLAITPGSQGYWLVSPNGAVQTFGNAVNYGSLAGQPLNEPIVGITATPDGKGYWLVAADGGVFAFGDATFYGSTGDLKLNKPIVGLTATPDGKGYWLVAADGGIFTFGDATYHGSTGDLQLNQPIVGMASDPDGGGYWLVASDGGVFTFGDATFDGSTGNLTLNKPIVGITTTPDGGGYWLLASDGGIFTFGDAAFFGSGGGQAGGTAVGMFTNAGGAGYTVVNSGGTATSFGAS
jgi:fibronectin type 3 domain-containing protein